MTEGVQRLIGKSYQNRDLYVYEYFVDDPKLNVLVHGSEHGTEIKGGVACERLMEDIETNNPDFYDDMNIVVSPRVNPDGNANFTYANAQGFQIMYCALNEATPEFRAFWEYMRDTKFSPHFAINNHNLDRFNRGTSYYLYDHVPRLAMNEDLVIGNTTLTGLYRHKLTWNQWTDIVKHVSTNAPGSVYEKFWEVDDYGNSSYNVPYDIGYWDSFIGAYCDTVCMLIEGVAPEDYTNMDDPAWEATIQAQFLANKYMIDWARKHPEICSSRSVNPYVGEKIPVYANRQIYEMFPDRHKVENDATGSITNFWAISTHNKVCHPTENIHWTTAPLAYAVHNTNEENVNIHLKWLGLDWTQGQAGDVYDVEQFHCTAADPWSDEDGDITYQWAQLNVNGFYVSSTRTNFSQYTIYSVTDQTFANGLVLMHILEPIALGNISRHQTIYPTLNLRANNDFPILRLIRKR